jgi:hypothetical protein
MGGDRRLYGVWACFALRLLFYATMLPLWEGYDEWAHFSVIRIMVTRGQFLVDRQTPIPKDVAASLGIAPVPWELRGLLAPSVTQDVFWRIDGGDRVAREEALRNLPREWRSAEGPATFAAYEGLQPPLYYWLMTPVLTLTDHWSLAAQVLTVRWISALIATLAIPLIFAIARAVFDDVDVALACSAMATLMPGWALDVARVSNDCLSVVFFSLVIWLGWKLAADGPQSRLAAGLGAALGFGLLTKAWFLTVIPAVAILFVWIWRCRKIVYPGRAVLASAGITVGMASAISGWWYIRNIVTNGTLSGLSESVMLRHNSVSDMLSGALELPWLKAVDSILFSHTITVAGVHSPSGPGCTTFFMPCCWRLRLECSARPGMLRPAGCSRSTQLSGPDNSTTWC